MEIKVNVTGDARKDKEALEHALGEFRKRVKKSGIMHELRRREYYMPPSKYKKWRQNESVKRRKREERKSEWQRNQRNDW